MIIAREPGGRYDVSFQSEDGTRLEAVEDLDDNPLISTSDAGTAKCTVNINTATAHELEETLPGIGSSKAEAIVEYRERMGGFTSVEELAEVDGIGAELLRRISPYCTISEPNGQ
ncbi:MAG: ComEA family DNA-binding protein [Ruminococcaceae bacterium]|nr:ComEA family DNA-binding protein [Oscillospiraceae bacterium]